MTSVREDLGYVERPRPFKPRPPVARFEGVRELGRDEWPAAFEAEVLKPDGRRTWVYDSDKTKAINRARSLVAALNGDRR